MVSTKDKSSFALWCGRYLWIPRCTKTSKQLWPVSRRNSYCSTCRSIEAVDSIAFFSSNSSDTSALVLNQEIESSLRKQACSTCGYPILCLRVLSEKYRHQRKTDERRKGRRRERGREERKKRGSAFVICDWLTQRVSGNPWGKGGERHTKGWERERDKLERVKEWDFVSHKIIKFDAELKHRRQNSRNILALNNYDILPFLRRLFLLSLLAPHVFGVHRSTWTCGLAASSSNLCPSFHFVLLSTNSSLAVVGFPLHCTGEVSKISDRRITEMRNIAYYWLCFVLKFPILLFERLWNHFLR